MGQKIQVILTIPDIMRENIGVLILLLFVLVFEFSWRGGGKFKLKH